MKALLMGSTACDLILALAPMHRAAASWLPAPLDYEIVDGRAYWYYVEPAEGPERWVWL